MQHKKVLVATLVLAAIFMAFGAYAETAATTKKITWKDYFTQDEAKMIKKLTQDYIIKQLDENDTEWKGVISAKQVDKSIAKKKVISGAVTCSTDFATKVVDDTGDKYYYKKLEFNKIKLAETPNIILYEKVAADDILMQLDSNIWRVDNSTPVSEGAVWYSYGVDQQSDPGLRCYSTEYKLVVTY